MDLEQLRGAEFVVRTWRNSVVQVMAERAPDDPADDAARREHFGAVLAHLDVATRELESALGLLGVEQIGLDD